ncbi:MAG: C40 family peptidase [Armatimonadota bacterium]|nr:C40 family peptidase [Armatimonadota bacterium]
MASVSPADTYLSIELPIRPPESSPSAPSRHSPPPVRAESRRTPAIGRLGVTTSPAPIYAARSTRSRLYARCEAMTYLAVTHEAGAWYGVLMIDGSVGWIPRQHVRLLDYEVLSASPTSFGALGERIVQTALRFLGIPYRWGGTSYNGLDCSGFVQKVFALNGIRLPRLGRHQAQVGTPIPDLSLLQPGDRLYFRSRKQPIAHTGIYIGNGYFIHAARSRGRVAIDRVTDPQYLKTLVGIRR